MPEIHFRFRFDPEVAWALAVGFVLNGFLLVADAQANVVSIASAVANTYAFAGALGGLTLAMIHFVGQAFAAAEVESHKVWRAAVEGVCAILVGAFVSHYFTGYLAAWVPRVDPADLLWLAYAIGVFAWRAMPLFIDQLPKVVSSVGDAIVAAIRRMVGGSS